jgi:hypothetical protein
MESWRVFLVSGSSSICKSLTIYGVLNFGTVFPQPNFLAAASKAILSMSSFTAMAGEEGLYFFFKEERTGKIP